MSNKYQESGVNLEKGYETVNRIKRHVKSTFNKGVLGNIGAFGGLFDLSKYNIKEPILVSGTDGVGTKLLLAQEANKHDTIGIDLVAMCVNDIVTVTAEPLYFLDYIATGELEPEVVEEVVKGIAEGCRQAGCALIGGETAEMPDMYLPNHYDLAGYTTGIVEKSQLPNIEDIQPGDAIIGIASSGIHSNGYSLVRKIFFKDNNFTLEHYFPELDSTLIEELLKPTRIYVKAIHNLKTRYHLKGIAHITGGGFIENLPRILPGNVGATILTSSFPIPPIFNLMEQLGNIPHNEMFNIFNMGIGMMLIVSQDQKDEVLKSLHNVGYNSHDIGVVTNKKGIKIV